MKRLFGKTHFVGLVVFLTLNCILPQKASADTCGCEECYTVTFPDPGSGGSRTEPVCLDLNSGGWIGCFEIGDTCAMVVNCQFVPGCRGPQDPIPPPIIGPVSQELRHEFVQLAQHSDIAPTCPTSATAQARDLAGESTLLTKKTQKYNAGPRVIYTF